MADLNRGGGSPTPGPRRPGNHWSALFAVAALFLSGCAADQESAVEGGPEASTVARDDNNAGAGHGADGQSEETDHQTTEDGSSDQGEGSDQSEGGWAEIVPDAVPMAADPAQGCSAVEAPEGVNVTWWGLPDEAELSIIGNGMALARTADRPDGVLTLFGAELADEDLIDLAYSTPTGGESLSCDLADLTGSGDTSTEQADEISPCSAGDCDPVAQGDQAGELITARDHFRSTAFGPHAYFIVDIDGIEEDLYLQADGQGGRTFIPPRADAEFLNPFTIHDELLAAIGDGSSVAYQLDSSSGLPVWATVDGSTTKLLCFEVDTAPPELRVGPCDPATDLIDR